MKRVYACLLGEWTDITDIGLLHEEIHDMFKYDYINVTVNNKNYRIHPSLIQIVTE